MNDDELLVQAAALPTVYFDGFGAFRKLNGVLRCVGFVIDSGAQMNLVVSLTGADSSTIEARRVLEGEPVKSIQMLERLRLAH